jgi:type IV pilus assembly protein PilM
MAKNAVGLDIGSNTVKIVQLNETKRGIQLCNFAMAQVPPETIVDGTIMDSRSMVDTIRELFSSQKIKNKDVAIAISGHSVIIKKINLPTMTQDELEESIQWEAEQYIPFDINDVNIDTQILNPQSKEQGQMDVLLVAAKKDIINDYSAIIAEAGLNLVCVDVAAFAVENAFEINYEVPSDEIIALLNIGASVSNINILYSGIPTFTRDIAMGGKQFTEELQKQLNVSYEEAETLKVGGDVTQDSDSILPQEVEKVLADVSETFASEIQRSFDFYSSQSVEGKISKIYLSGGTSKLPSIVRAMEKRMGIGIEVMNPFKNIIIDEKKFDISYLKSIAPQATVGVGLGLRRRDEK